jgi:hypothetical protein
MLFIYVNYLLLLWIMFVYIINIRCPCAADFALFFKLAAPGGERGNKNRELIPTLHRYKYHFSIIWQHYTETSVGCLFDTLVGNSCESWQASQSIHFDPKHMLAMAYVAWWFSFLRYGLCSKGMFFFFFFCFGSVVVLNLPQKRLLFLLWINFTFQLVLWKPSAFATY